MKQRGDGRWSGHHDITYASVTRLYQHLAEPDATIPLGHLGAAAHALQDSYSGAHAWREDSVYDGDPTAPLVSLHVLTPAHAGRLSTRQTGPARPSGSVSRGISSEGVGRGG
jgi:hypothetical protein